MQVIAGFETAIARKYPEGIAIAIARDAGGVDNPITLCWVMRTSFEPPMLAMSIAQTRYSLEVVRRAREFVISLPTTSMQKDTIFFGTVSGRDVNKLAACGLRTEPASVIQCVLLTDAVANFECRLESETHTGDHVLFVGRVVASHMNVDRGVRGLYALGDYRFGGVVAG